MNRNDAIETLLHFAESELQIMGGQDGYEELGDAVVLLRKEQQALAHLSDGDPRGWEDAGESTFYAFEALRDAKTIGEQSRAFDGLSNSISDMATYLPNYNYKTGQLDLNGPVEEA